MIYLGILEEGRFFFLMGERLVRVNGNDIGFFVQNRACYMYTV